MAGKLTRSVASQRGHGSDIALSPQAREAHRLMVGALQKMVRRRFSTCLDPAFGVLFRRFLDLTEEYQTAVLEAEQRTPSCGHGCTLCCSHWVEDVYSYEAELIAEHLRRHWPERIADILRVCEEDVQTMERLDSVVSQTMERTEAEMAAAGEQFDSVDLLLASFYGLRRPCPLLGEDGGCIAYAVRPLTCRIYVSFSEPHRCEADLINEGPPPTCLLDLEEDVNELLDSLHFRFDRFDSDTGLRSVLAKCLREGPPI